MCDVCQKDRVFRMYTLKGDVSADVEGQYPDLAIARRMTTNMYVGGERCYRGDWLAMSDGGRIDIIHHAEFLKLYERVTGVRLQAEGASSEKAQS